MACDGAAWPPVVQRPVRRVRTRAVGPLALTMRAPVDLVFVRHFDVKLLAKRPHVEKVLSIENVAGVKFHRLFGRKTIYSLAVDRSSAGERAGWIRNSVFDRAVDSISCVVEKTDYVNPLGGLDCRLRQSTMC